MPHLPIRFLFNGWLIILLLAGCSGQALHPTPTPLSALASPTPTAKLAASSTATPQPTETPRESDPTTAPRPIVPTFTPTPKPAELQLHRSDIDRDHVQQLQILAQWSTGAEESRYRWDNDSTRLLLVSASIVRLIDLQTFQQLWEAPGGDDAQFSSDGTQVAVNNGTEVRLLRASDGLPDQSGQAFKAAVLTEMVLPLKDMPGVDSYPAIIQNGTHYKLLYQYGYVKGCPDTGYTDLPAGITGYALSPDRTLLLVASRGENTHPDYQAVIYGINSGAEAPLPAHLTGSEDPGFHPTRPGFGVTPFVPSQPPPVLGWNEYPPAIDPPQGALEAYRLDGLDEASALTMLKDLVDYRLYNDVHGAADGRGSLYLAQDAVLTGLEEFLGRFPQSEHIAAVQWQLALTNTINDNHASDAWIADQIEQALNRQDMAPGLLSLNAGLAPFGFYVESAFQQAPAASTDEYCDPASAPPSPLVVNNLFGDQHDSLVFMLKNVWSYVGVLYALTQDSQGQYHVYSIGGQWGVYAGMGQTVQIMDLLGDGQPVIRLDYIWHDGSMNGVETYFYRWQAKSPAEGNFIELTGGISSGFDAQVNDFQFPNGPGTTKKIVAPRLGNQLFEPELILTWDGQRYVHSKHIPIPGNTGEDRDQLVAATANHQFEEVATYINSLTNDQPWQHFFLGYVEALQFHPGQARLGLQPLADKVKKDPSSGVEYRAAQAFLEQYQSGTDVARACQAALKVTKEIYCNPVLVTRSFLEWLSHQPPGDLPTRLAEYGIQFSSQTSLDINGDGRLDWILGQKQPEPDTSQDYSYKDYAVRDPIWLVISGDNGFQFLNLASITHYFGGLLSWTSLRLGGGEDGKAVQVIVLKEGQGLDFFRLHQEAGIYSIEGLFPYEGASSYQVVEQKDGSRQLILFHNNHGSFSPPTRFRWNPVTENFDGTDYLDQLLFVEHNPAEALSIIPGLLEYVQTNANPDNEYWKFVHVPLLQFYLGLAYELNGDLDKARDIYYALWKAHPLNTEAETSLGPEHPDQPYAIMARARLERK